MENPWLRIPLADYEGHMALPRVAQARLLSDIFAAALGEHAPRSVAVLGCAGGNGFDRIPVETTERVVGIDLNPDYILQARARFEGRLPGLELFTGDLQTDEFAFSAVELVFAGLLFEYVDVGVVLGRTRAMLCPGGVLQTVVQLPSPAIAEVTPSPYASLGALSSIMRLVAPEALERKAAERGLRQIAAHTVAAEGGKLFCVQTFRREGADAGELGCPGEQSDDGRAVRSDRMDFHNCYEDGAYAEAYAKLEFPGTYYLAFRDLPEIFARHARGRQALDFGCGTGRSTRFLVRHGFQAVGVDISSEMVRRARIIDPAGDYRLVSDGDLRQFPDASLDLILSAFTFDNVPTRAKKTALFGELRRLLRPAGRIVSLVSSPEMYWHEWASFSTRDFPENRQARRGDQVRIVVTALEDRRPAIDILWPDEAYRDVYAQARLSVLDVHQPLGRADEPYEWVSETTTPPWTIYVLGPEAG